VSGSLSNPAIGATPVNGGDGGGGGRSLPRRVLGGRYGLLAPVRAFVANRVLIFRLAKREIAARYQGSALGALWLVISPLLQLLIYTFVFSIVFRAKWDLPQTEQEQGRLVFAVVFFSGLIVYNIFAECVNRGPRLILENPNYVKRLVFPLEIMPWVSCVSALFNFLIGLCLLLVIYVIEFGVPPLTAIAAPLPLVPFVLMTIGIAYWLAATGVYLRDLGQVVGLVTMLMMFVTPIFYSVDQVPESFRVFIHLNPISSVLGQVRGCLFHGTWPSAVWLVSATAIGWAVMYGGYAWFEKTRKGFADVV
jgi:lipopolysaccharide transport system permease protein